MDILSQLSQGDAFLILGNMIFGVMGATGGSLMISSDLNDNKNKATDIKGSWSLPSINWSLSRIIIGVYFSIFVSLCTAGNFSEDIYQIFKVFAFTLAASAFAPKIWSSQEKKLLKIIDDRIKDNQS
jgi:hypothetical protein